MKAAADAGAEREQFGRAESLGQPPVAREHDAQERLGIEVLARKHAQFAKDGREHFLGFVNDEHRPHQSGGDVFPPSGAQRLEARPAVVRRKRDTENVAEFAIKIRYPTLGMIHGADDERVGGAKLVGRRRDAETAAVT